MKRWLTVMLCAVIGASPVLAETKSAATRAIVASGAWARATVPGQSGTGAFMTLTSAQGARLVGAASEVAGVVEIHEMTMENNVMRMRSISALDLPAGRAVRLAPGGHHVMLMDLKRPLAAGEKIRVELRLETVDKRLITQPVDVEVRARAPEPASAGHKH